MSPPFFLASLALLASCVGALVCDGSKNVPCFELHGGTSVPQVAMGTWSASYKDCKTGDFACAKSHARSAVENWLHIGGTHIDGANDYRTQTSISDALQSSGVLREDVFITTKCPGAIGYQATIQCADDNLQMLGQFGAKGVGYIDLLLIHFPFIIKPMCRFHFDSPECQDHNTSHAAASKQALQDTWRAMEELKRIGVVKSIGVSDYNTAQLMDTLEVATQPIDLHQVEWNILKHDEEMLAFCEKNSIQLQAWSPLGGAGGSVLSIPNVVKVAAAHGVSTAQVALKWALQRGVAVVVGTVNPAHAAGDLDLFTFELSRGEVSLLSKTQPGESFHV